MKTFFREKIYQKHFDKKGYVIIPSLIDAGEIEELTRVFRKFSDECSTAFHTTHFSKNFEYKKQAHEAISKIVFAKVEKFVIDYVPLFGNYMVKNPDPNFGMDIHTDWTYVDESKHTSLAIWIPLIDVDEKNGCLGIVEGSHKITNKIRGPLIRESSRDLNEYWASEYGKLLEMKAGDAIIYHHGLLHFSPPNKSGKVRPALNLTIAPADAEWIHYCMPEGSKEIELYKVDDPDFYLHYTHFQRPEKNTLIKKLPSEKVEYIDRRMKNYKLKKMWRELKTTLFPA